MDFAKNEKCATGVGSFITAMARVLELKVEEMGPLSLKSNRIIPMNVTCVVFVESEMVRRVGIEKEVALIGGVAKKIGVVERLKEHLGTEILIPEEPQIVGALGAALFAQG